MSDVIVRTRCGQPDLCSQHRLSRMLTHSAHPTQGLAIKQILAGSARAGTTWGLGRFQKECWLPDLHPVLLGRAERPLSCRPNHPGKRPCRRWLGHILLHNSWIPRPETTRETTMLVVQVPPLATKASLPPAATAIKRCRADKSLDSTSWLSATKEGD